MRAYAAIFSARMRTLLQYRAAAFGGFATQLFWGFLRIIIFRVYYSAAKTPPPMNLMDMVSYLWLMQAFFALTLPQVDPDVRVMIRTGTVAYEMLRPVDVYWLWFSRAVASRLAPTLLRCAPLLLVAGFCGLQPPASLASGVAFALSMIGATLLIASFAALITISMLYTIAGEGMMRLAPTLVYLSSGMLIPLPLLPDAMQPLLNFLPFRGVIDVPFRLYTGHIPASEAGYAIAHQFAWTLVFVLIGRWALARAARRLVVQGG